MFNNAVDTTIGGGSVAAGLSLYLGYVQTGISWFMLIGGVALLLLRLAIAWREWRQGRKTAKKAQEKWD